MTNRRPKARMLTRRDFLVTSTGAGAGLLILAGCGGGTSGQESGTVSYLVSGGESPQATEYWDQAIQSFEEEHETDIERTTVGWDAAHDEIFNRLRAGDAPDLIYLGSRWINEFASLENGIRSLEEFMTSEMKQQYYSSVLGTVQSGGTTYAVPNNYSTKGLIYRTDLIEEPPRTWDELVSTAQAVQNENPGMYGIGISAAAHVSTVDQFSQFLYQAGGTVFDEEGNVAFNNDTGVEALTYYTDFYLRHQVTPNPLDSNREELPNLFRNQSIAMMLLGPWAHSAMGLEPENEEVPYTSAPLPSGERIATELVTDSIVMSSTSENQDSAWQFVQFIATPEQQAQKDVIMGGVPPMPEETEIESRFTEDPYFKTFVDMSEYGVPAPQPAVWQPFEDIIINMVQTVLLEQATPGQAVEEAAQAIRREQLEPPSA